jgi:hypothetical protein
MPAFLVELAEDEKATLQGNKLGKVIVFAGSSADAKDVAAGSSEGDSNTAWQNATVTDLSTVPEFDHLSLEVTVHGQSPEISDTVTAPTGNVVKTVTINGAGTGYSVNDILVLSTGTFTRAATCRVTAETGGLIDSVELVDPGDAYTVDPTASAGATTGGNADATVDVTVVGDDYHNLMGAIVTALNANAAIAGAAMDFGTGSGGTLTIATGGGGDDLGDAMVTAKFYLTADGGKVGIDAMLGTLVSEGVSTDPLTVLGMATQVAGKVLATL